MSILIPDENTNKRNSNLSVKNEELVQNFQDSTLENKENLNLKPIFIVYRDNNLYSDLIPGILKNLEQLGRKVYIQSFPKGTEESIIQKWCLDNEEKISSSELLFDNTSVSQLPDETKKTLEIKWLDTLSEKIMTSSFLWWKLKETEVYSYMLNQELSVIDKRRNSAISSVNLYKNDFKIFTNLLKEIISNNNLPKKVYISKLHLDSHMFKINSVQEEDSFFDLLDIFENGFVEDLIKQNKFNNNREVLKYIYSLDDSENLVYVKTVMRELCSFLEIDEDILFDLIMKKTEWGEAFIHFYQNILSNKFKSILKDLGISESCINIVNRSGEVKNDADNVWVIADRHDNTTNILNKSVIIDLPIESMIHRIMKEWKLNFKNVDFQQLSSKEIQKLFWTEIDKKE